MFLGVALHHLDEEAPEGRVLYVAQPLLSLLQFMCVLILVLHEFLCGS